MSAYQERYRGAFAPPPPVGAPCASDRHHDCNGIAPYGNGLWVYCGCKKVGCVCALVDITDWSPDR